MKQWVVFQTWIELAITPGRSKPEEASSPLLKHYPRTSTVSRRTSGALFLAGEGIHNVKLAIWKAKGGRYGAKWHTLDVGRANLRASERAGGARYAGLATGR